MMKDFCVSLALVVAIALSAQVSYAAWEGIQSLNPLPYIGIGQNNSDFSLNPFTGFKNCNKCKVERVAYCEDQTVNTCNTCKRAFMQPKCNTCNREYVQPVIIPRCNSCGH